MNNDCKHLKTKTSDHLDKDVRTCIDCGLKFYRKDQGSNYCEKCDKDIAEGKRKMYHCNCPKCFTAHLLHDTCKLD